MASAVSICNLALARIGDSANIASIDPPEQSAQAQMCSIFYPMSVSACLEMFDWSFATRQVSVARLANAEPGGWKYVFPVPSDCLRLIRIRDYHWQSGKVLVGKPPIPLRLGADVRYETGAVGNQRVFYCDAEHPVVTYISGDTNVAMFSPAFVDALAWHLAGALCGARVKGKEGQQLAQLCQRQFAVSLSVARDRDAQQQKKRIEFIPSWLRAR